MAFEDPTVEFGTTQEFRLYPKWDRDIAALAYHLEVHTYQTVLVKTLHHSSYVNSGDKEWADRTAAHYGIEIEEAE